jgi:hypothetical protein
MQPHAEARINPTRAMLLYNERVRPELLIPRPGYFFYYLGTQGQYSRERDQARGSGGK